MRVALDLDSTLAATSLTAFELMGEDYTYEDIDSWSWGTDKFGTARYLNAMWHAWTIRPDSIPPMGDGLRGSVSHIYDRADTLDIVTSHPDDMLGVDEGKKQWLADYGIPFDDYVSVNTSKMGLNYDVYIDDKPDLAQQAAGTDSTVLLRDHPYNRDTDLPGEASRVQSVREASMWFPRPAHLD